MTPVGEPGPVPVEVDGEPAAEADQQKEVNHGPRQPRQIALQPQPAEVGDGPRAADHRHAAPVPVAERQRGGFAFDASCDNLSNVAPLLLDNGRQPRQRSGSRRRPNGEDLRMPRGRAIGGNDQGLVAGRLRPNPSGSGPSLGAGRPDHVGARRRRRFLPVDDLDGLTEADLDAERLERPQGMGRLLPCERGQHRVPGLHQHDRACWPETRRKPPARVVRAISTPVGPAPTTTKVRRRSMSAASWLRSAASKAASWRSRMRRHRRAT